MIGKSERRSREFLTWESRGRGFHIWMHPVSPEPPFAAFWSGAAKEEPVDDGKKPTFLSGLVRKMSERLSPAQSAPEKEPDEPTTPDEMERGELVELRAHIPQSLKIGADAYEGFFKSVSSCSGPISYEMVATRERITAQFVVSKNDLRLFTRQLEAFFPDVAFEPISGHLESVWAAGEAHTVLEFGLGKEFAVPITLGHSDPFVGLVGALSEIEESEVAVFQVTYVPTEHPWEESIMRSVTHGDGSAMFVNAPELLPGAREKVSRQLFAAVVRLAVRAENEDRVWEIATNVAGALGAYGSQSGNELVPLPNDGYPSEEHEADFLARQTRRSGMLLNSKELSGFVHIPTGEVVSPRLRVKTGRTKAAPAYLRGQGLVLGTNSHHGVEMAVSLSSEQRVRHVHVIGASGTGKSTLLFNMLRQDVEMGVGLTLLDPHGDLVDRVLEIIPPERVGDVVLLDPSDEEFTVGFNILSAHSDWEKNLLASDLVSVFRRNSAAWGDQMNSVLQNAILALLESKRGGTLLDLRRFLLEPAFRNEFLKTIHDENIQYYWRHGFTSLSGNKSVGSIVTRLDAFLSPKALKALSPGDSRRVLYELRVHQIELEMQNDELRRAQVDLIVSRTRYFDLYDLAPVGYCTLNEAGLILQANLCAATLMGTMRDSLVKQPISRFIHTADFDQFHLQCKELHAAHASSLAAKLACELRIVHHDRTPIWVHLAATVAGDEVGAPTLRLVLSDVTERRLMDAALRESEEQRWAILQTAMAGFWVVDCNGWLLEVNEAYSVMSGYSMSELLTKRIANLEAPETAEATADHVQRSLGGERSRFESRHRRKDGSIFDVEVSFQFRPVDGGQLVVFLQDISERRRAEEALSRLSRLAVAVRDTRDAITVQDKDGRLLTWSPGAERIYGWSEAEALRMNVRVRIPPERREAELAKLRELCEAETPEFYRTQRIAKSGAVVAVSIIATALFDQAGQVYAMATTERVIAGGAA